MELLVTRALRFNKARNTEKKSIYYYEYISSGMDPQGVHNFSPPPKNLSPLPQKQCSSLRNVYGLTTRTKVAVKLSASLQNISAGSKPIKENKTLK